MKSILLELAETMFYQMEATSLHQYKHIVLSNILNRLELDEKSLQHRIGGIARLVPQDTNYVAQDGEDLQILHRIMKEDDQFVSILYVEGPITRNGGACSYGSKQMASLMKMAAGMHQCKGQVVVIDSPGGVCGAEIDFQEGIDALHAAGIPVVAVVTGNAASMGYNFAVRCDKIYAANPKHRVGCIGTMMEGFINADGDENSITKEKFINMYARQSVKKNYMFRELMAGNREPMQQELDRLAQEFMDAVKTNRPACTDEQLTGEMYEAGTVIESMVDGIKSVNQVVEEMLGVSEEGVSEEEDTNTQHPTPNTEDEPDDKCNKPKNMLENLAKAANVESLETTEEGLFLTPEMAESVEQLLAQQSNSHAEALQALQNRINELEAAAAEAENLRDELNGKLTAAQELNNQLTEQNENLGAQITEKETAITEAQQTISEKETVIAEKEAIIAEKEAIIAEKEATIAQMAEQPTEQQLPPAPQDNSTTGERKPSEALCPRNATPAEKRAWLANRMKHLAKNAI